MPMTHKSIVSVVMVTMIISLVSVCVMDVQQAAPQHGGNGSIVVCVGRQHQIPDDLLTVGLDFVPLSVRSFRDLGIYLDSDLSMRTHVTRTVSSCIAVLQLIHVVSMTDISVISRSCSRLSCRWCCHVSIMVVQH